MDEISASTERMLIEVYSPFMGRTHITTSCLPSDMQFPSYKGDTLDETTIARELARAVSLHRDSMNQFRALRAIYKGNQSILDRVQTDDMRSNNKIVLNYAQAFTRDIVGYTYSSGTSYSARTPDKTDEVQELDGILQEQFITAVRKAAADDQSIGGHGYVEVLSQDDGDSPLQVVHLQPDNTEVVYSEYNPNLRVFAWNSYEATIDNKKVTLYNVYTNKRIYTVSSTGSQFSDPLPFVLNNGVTQTVLPFQPNPMGAIPIIEYRNNQFNIGDWECAISLFEALNNVASDSVNDVENIVKSILCVFGVDPDSVNIDKNKKGGFMLLFPNTGGVQQDAKFISQPLDGASVDLLRSYLSEAMMFITGIPSRDTGVSGSDTGVSAQARTGANDIETVAANKVMFTKMAERQLLRTVLSVLHSKGRLTNLVSSDVDIEIPRSKLNGVQSRVQSMAQLYGIGVDPVDVAKLGDLTTDLTGFVKRWQDNLAKQTAAQTAQTVGTTAETPVNSTTEDTANVQ